MSTRFARCATLAGHKYVKERDSVYLPGPWYWAGAWPGMKLNVRIRVPFSNDQATN